MNSEVASISFPCFYLSSAKIIWISKAFSKKENAFETLKAALVSCVDETHFVKAFFDFERFSKTLFAEGYGGDGNDYNGGGVRVGNFDETLQIKGIGRNPLAGLESSSSHSFGGLLLDQAAIEVVFSNLVDKILPFGACSIYGLATTGINFDFRDEVLASWRSEGGKGALLFRERSIRPAHFLQNRAFKPRCHRASIFRDLERCRSILNSEVKKRNFHSVLATFLRCTARQFAYAHIYGLMHGTLSASNLTMDGRWIDLNFCSIVPPLSDRKLLKGQTSFCDECFFPAHVAMEALHTFNKFSWKRPCKTLKVAETYHRYFVEARIEALFTLLGLDIAMAASEITMVEKIFHIILNRETLTTQKTVHDYFHKWLWLIQRILIDPLLKGLGAFRRYLEPYDEFICYSRMVIKIARLQSFSNDMIADIFRKICDKPQQIADSLEEFSIIIDDLFEENDKYIFINFPNEKEKFQFVFDKKEMKICKLETIITKNILPLKNPLFDNHHSWGEMIDFLSRNATALQGKKRGNHRVF